MRQPVPSDADDANHVQIATSAKPDEPKVRISQSPFALAGKVTRFTTRMGCVVLGSSVRADDRPRALFGRQNARSYVYKREGHWNHTPRRGGYCRRSPAIGLFIRSRGLTVIRLQPLFACSHHSFLESVAGNLLPVVARLLLRHDETTIRGSFK